jgi:hypothetical protein
LNRILHHKFRCNSAHLFLSQIVFYPFGR